MCKSKWNQWSKNIYMYRRRKESKNNISHRVSFLNNYQKDSFNINRNGTITDPRIYRGEKEGVKVTFFAALRKNYVQCVNRSGTITDPRIYRGEKEGVKVTFFLA